MEHEVQCGIYQVGQCLYRGYQFIDILFFTYSFSLIGVVKKKLILNSYTYPSLILIWSMVKLIILYLLPPRKFKIY